MSKIPDDVVEKANEAWSNVYRVNPYANPETILRAVGVIFVEFALEKAAAEMEALRDSDENSDKWTITRRMAFNDAAAATRALKPKTDAQ